MNTTPHPSPLPSRGEGVKSCAHCGAVITNATVLEAQYFCDINCVAAWIRDKTKQWRTTVKKECVQCGQPMKPRENESRAMYARRITCSHSCAALWGQMKKPTPRLNVPETKTCQHCEGVFKQRENEAAHAFLNRKFCSKSCTAQARTRYGDVVERKREQNRRYKDKVRAKKQKERISRVTLKPTVTAAEVMAQREATRQVFTPITETYGVTCKQCCEGVANPYTGLCPKCFLTQQRKEKAIARVGYE